MKELFKKIADKISASICNSLFYSQPKLSNQLNIIIQPTIVSIRLSSLPIQQLLHPQIGKYHNQVNGRNRVVMYSEIND